MGSEDFIEEMNRLLQIQDRFCRFRNHHTLGGSSYADVYVNFVNLPEEIVARKEGGGAESENNRMSFWIEGFGKSGPHKPPPSGKVKVKMANSALPRVYTLRAKTGTPLVIAKYLADFLNRVVREVEPKYTHTRV